jgi:hypothetical protein
MQTELNKVVAALREFYAHEAYLFETARADHDT